MGLIRIEAPPPRFAAARVLALTSAAWGLRVATRTLHTPFLFAI